jgi:hypothetical protein
MPINWRMFYFHGKDLESLHLRYFKARTHRTERLYRRRNELLYIPTISETPIVLAERVDCSILRLGPRSRRFKTEVECLHKIETNFTDYDTCSYNYSKQEWFHCRRANCANKSVDKAPCSECETSNREIIQDEASCYGLGSWQWRLVCGFCNLKATEQYPHGYKSCFCAEDMSEQTCTPCFDRLLDVWRKRCMTQQEN